MPSFDFLPPRGVFLRVFACRFPADVVGFDTKPHCFLSKLSRLLCHRINTCALVHLNIST